MDKGPRLYQKAKKMIPGGTQLLSKRPEQFLPEYWPAYYSRAKGCRVWDLDGKEYIDACYMGIGANVLGYAFDTVDDAVKKSIDSGSMCTLNAPEEVELAEKLLELHPWAGMVRYAKSGGEATALAVRIARACTQKEKILICGYHGWHDWYLAANLKTDALGSHLLSGLEPNGVPKQLLDTVLTFRYNDIGGFEALIEANKGSIAAVVMEPVRNDAPAGGFLERIRELTRAQGIVLIFDEITAGFRIACGGSHLKLQVQPDMAVFGKAIANGYPISAVIGKAEIMDAAQSTFISSTFWTERTGFAGAVASIRFFQENSVEKHLSLVGQMVQNGWRKAADESGLEAAVNGIYPLSHLEFRYEDALACKTYFTQEMLKRGFLATTGFYASFSHSEQIVRQYLEACAEVFRNLSDLKHSGKAVRDFLDGPVCQSGFARLN